MELVWPASCEGLEFRCSRSIVRTVSRAGAPASPILPTRWRPRAPRSQAGPKERVGRDGNVEAIRALVVAKRNRARRRSRP